jgi:hypothetical protein
LTARRSRSRFGRDRVDALRVRPARHADIDAMYHEKYDACGAGIVGSVVGPDAAGVTLRLSRTT